MHILQIYDRKLEIYPQRALVLHEHTDRFVGMFPVEGISPA